MRDTIAKAMALLPPRLRRRWIATAPVALAAAAAEGVAVAGLYAFIHAVQGSPLGPLFAGWPLGRPGLVAFAVVLAGVTVVKNGLQLAASAWQARLIADSITTVSDRLLARYAAVSDPRLAPRDTAQSLRTLTWSVDVAYQLVLGFAAALVTEALVVAAVVGVLLVTAPVMTIAVVVVLGGLLTVLLRRTRAAQLAWGAREEVLRATVLGLTRELLEARKELCLLGREDDFRGRVVEAITGLGAVRRRSLRWSGMPRALVETVFVGGGLLAAALAILLRDADPDLLPLFGIYAYAGFRIIPSANRILQSVQSIRAGAAAVANVHADATAPSPTPPGDLDPGPIAALSCEAVALGWDPETPAVGGVDVRIRRGEWIGIVGATGAGKSTLVDGLLGVLAPRAGRITVNGQPIDACRRAYWRRIGFVPQRGHLVDDTLRRNVALGEPDGAIDPARVTAAIARAHLADLVATLPAGLETRVGEGGTRLSGGERQRVAIARALYRDPELLFLDEATAALDYATEARVLEALRDWSGERTVVLVSHRLQTVRSCDRILFLAGGRLAAVGTWDELVASDAGFRALAAAATPRVPET